MKASEVSKKKAEREQRSIRELTEAEQAAVTGGGEEDPIGGTIGGTIGATVANTDSSTDGLKDKL